MNRHLDVMPAPHRAPLPPLPVVDWKAVGREAPANVKVRYKGPKASLPKADVVVITWTTAEWSALDHVFANSDTERTASSREFETEWNLYTKGAPKVAKTGKYTPAPLWGLYRVVKIDDATGKPQRVLLFKADAHLAYSPWIEGLESMVSHIIEDAQPDRLYSVGTAGGATLKDKLGDAVITNSAHLRLKLKQNLGVNYNHQTFTSPWFPSTDVIPDVEKKLLMPLDSLVTDAELKYLLRELYAENPAAKKFGLADLVNAPVKPSNLGSPRGLLRKNVPILTTDTYYIAKGDNAKKYSALEMDDAVIAKVAGDNDTKYCFVRNISDPIVPAVTRKKEAIPPKVRSDWSGQIYNNFGFYTSFNGALLTWATIAGHEG